MYKAMELVGYVELDGISTLLAMGEIDGFVRESCSLFSWNELY
jgi:hypothetical protein